MLYVSDSFAINWEIETVHDPKYFDLTDRSLVVDKNNVPHIFYGESYLYHSYLEGNNWVTEIIDSEPWVGKFSTATMDAEGYFHVIYSARTAIRYATNKSGSWILQNIPHSFDWFFNSYIGKMSFSHPIGVGGIAVDSTGIVHVAYVSDQNLLYFNNSTSSWPLTIVDEGCCELNKGRINVLVDTNDQLHITYNYYVRGESRLKYATYIDNQWVFEVVAEFGASYNSASIDSFGAIQMVYVLAGRLYYLTNKTGQWSSELLSDSAKEHISISLDSNDNAHISYITCDTPCQYINYKLEYANNVTGSWLSETARASDSFYYASISMDSNNKAHISFATYLTANLEYVTNKTDSWDYANVSDSDRDLHILDSIDRIGLESDFVEDADGHIHAAYRGGSVFSGQLYYATNQTGSWAITKLKGFAPTNYMNKMSIAVDLNGNPFIAYTSGPYIGLVRKDSEIWTDERIDAGSAADNTEINLLVDNENNLHLTYFLWDGRLRYAKRTGNQWVIETVADTGESIGNYSDYTSSLFIDDNGYPHIGYIDRNGDLFYASIESGGWTNIFLASSTIDHRWGDKDYIVMPSGIFYLAYSSATCTAGICLNTGLEYMTNVNGVIDYDSVDYELYDLFGVVQSYPMTSPSIAIDKSGNISTTYTYVFLPNGSGSWPYEYFMRSARKVGQLWRVSPIVQDGFATSDTGYDIFDGLDSSKIKYDSNGNGVVSYFNGYRGSFELARSSHSNAPLINIFSNVDDLSFDTVPIGSSKVTEINIENLGQEPLQVNNITLITDDQVEYVLDLSAGSNPCQLSTFSLLSGERCSFEISFNPTRPYESVYSSLVIESNDSELPVISGELSGRGVPQENDLSNNNTSPDNSGGGGNISFLLIAIIMILRYNRYRGTSDRLLRLTI